MGESHPPQDAIDLVNPLSYSASGLLCPKGPGLKLGVVSPEAFFETLPFLSSLV